MLYVWGCGGGCRVCEDIEIEIVNGILLKGAVELCEFWYYFLSLDSTCLGKLSC